MTTTEAVFGSPAATDLARTQVIQHAEGLSPAERDAILTTEPEMGQHVMGMTLREYYWWWKLPTGRTVTARYLGKKNIPIDPNGISIRMSEQDIKESRED